MLRQLSPSQAGPAPFPSPIQPPVVSRWSASAWALVRDGGGTALAAGGMLGGSQAGARLSYRLSGPVALSARFYTPLEQANGAEAAVGVEWKPSRALPVTLLAERRQRLGKNGRSAFALTAYGGVSEVRIAGAVALDAYAQAGVVGTKSRDLFVDGFASLSLPAADDGKLRLGLGLWGAAQPGVARLDAGPHVSYRLPVNGVPARLSLEWRQRLAGDAAPASGPALTLSTAF